MYPYFCYRSLSGSRNYKEIYRENTLVFYPYTCYHSLILPLFLLSKNYELALDNLLMGKNMLSYRVFLPLYLLSFLYFGNIILCT